MKQNEYTFKFNGQTHIMPDPIIISSEALKYATQEKVSGLIVAYDPKTSAGGVLLPNLIIGKPQWVIYIPIIRQEFALKINKLAAEIPIPKNSIN